jgi:prevent-host-death family protein
MGVKKAGIREAGLRLAALLKEVRKGRVIVLTEHGRSVARLAPLQDETPGAFESHRRFRMAIGQLRAPISTALSEDRADRM